jgi:hypothetical protein
MTVSKPRAVLRSRCLEGADVSAIIPAAAPLLDSLSLVVRCDIRRAVRPRCRSASKEQRRFGRPQRWSSSILIARGADAGDLARASLR